MSSLRLHPTHGVNPTIPICFWCGGDQGAVVLLGASYKGKAPMRMLLNYDPCDKCKQGFDLGVLFIEATTSPQFDNQPILKDSPPTYPTGTIAVIKREAAIKMFGENPHSKYLVSPADWDEMGLPRETINNG